jgi:hypothetical protein
MKEAQEQTARFTDLEMCEFERICEYAYRGDYTNPEATVFDEGELNIKEDFYRLSDSIAARENEKDHTEIIASFLTVFCGSLRLDFHDDKPRTVNDLPPLNWIANGWPTPHEDDVPGFSHWKHDNTDTPLGHA